MVGGRGVGLNLGIGGVWEMGMGGGGVWGNLGNGDFGDRDDWRTIPPISMELSAWYGIESPRLTKPY